MNNRMTALLALLAVAGFQNRDKIAEWLKTTQGKMGSLAKEAGASPGGSLPGNLGGMLAGKSVGDLLSGGLRDLVSPIRGEDGVELVQLSLNDRSSSAGGVDAIRVGKQEPLVGIVRA